MLAQDLGDRDAGLAFLEDGDDLRLSEIRLLHRTLLDSQSCQKKSTSECLPNGKAYARTY
jgi:hypothetical protein